MLCFQGEQFHIKHNSRIFLALPTLSHMAGNPSHVPTSAQIANHAGTNPVAVRHVLGQPGEAGLLTSEKGHSGGWRATLKISAFRMFIFLWTKALFQLEPKITPLLFL